MEAPRNGEVKQSCKPRHKLSRQPGSKYGGRLTIRGAGQVRVQVIFVPSCCLVIAPQDIVRKRMHCNLEGGERKEALTFDSNKDKQPSSHPTAVKIQLTPLQVTNSPVS